MIDKLSNLLEKCRNSAKNFTPDDVLKKCIKAAKQEGSARVRTISHSQKKSKSPAFGGRSIKWADFQSALMTAVEATWQEEHGTWKLAGGVDHDGEPLTVPIVVLIDTEDVYVWTGF